MTKKKTTTSSKSEKKTKVSASKSAAAGGERQKVSTPSKTVSKPTAKKSSVSRTPNKKSSQTVRKKANEVKSKRAAKAPADTAKTDVESKVREIVGKNNANAVGEKKESKCFSLDDVRQILKDKTKKPDAVTGGNALKSKPSATSKKQTASTRQKVSKVKKIQTASIDDILGFGSIGTSSRPIRDENKVPKAWMPYYKDLMNLRTSLKGALGERSQDTLGASARESSGELSLNSSDAGSDTFNRDVALSMVASEQEALEEIEDAIDRIFDGTFGICQETKKPIKKARLKVVPFTRFSLEGQTMHETRKRRESDSGGGAFATISDSTMGLDD